jgi:thiamine biosynthesis lipoprotein ApbE
MKRSAALAALSRDHHHALEAARRLRRAGAGDLDPAVAHLQTFWHPPGRRHFEIEQPHQTWPRFRYGRRWLRLPRPSSRTR